MDTVPDYEPLVNLRKELHKFPELSDREEATSRRILEFLNLLAPDEILQNLGGKGLAARFLSGAPGPRVMIRAELDALPIHEINDFEYKSVNRGVSHKCGHDGHMAIAAGVARWFSRERHNRGELVVLFQPSEENGKGACAVIRDNRFRLVEPDIVLALHNLPGYDRHEIILREGVFASASEGMIVELKGKTAHAGEPHKGVSPSAAVSGILRDLPRLSESRDFNDFILATIIHARIGETAFGTSPADAVIMATLRADNESDLKKLRSRAKDLVKNIALGEKLKFSVKRTERFPPTTNDPSLTRLAGEVAGRLGYKTRYIKNAFRWSEDFGWFTGKYKGILFGLGAGKAHAGLHNPDYDFPDELIGTGVKVMGNICRELLK
jgi:amidohydrolase